MRFSRPALLLLLILSTLASMKLVFAYSRITWVDLWVDPLGVGGHIHQEIPVQADIYTGNNVVEYVHDVTATLLLPPNVTVVSGENPLYIGEMGPGPSFVRCLWSLEFEEPGSYLLMVNATCIDTQKLPQWMSASATVRIYAPPHVEFEYAPTSDMHVNDTVLFNASRSFARGPDAAIIAYAWDFGDNSTTTTNSTIVEHEFISAGNYIVSLNITDNHDLASVYTLEISIKEKPLLGDINLDGRVNIEDITMVAIVFGSIEGEPRWNEKCDLNEDKIINILDLTVVAKEYGKTA